jgi:hypothetical protein
MRRIPPIALIAALALAAAACSGGEDITANEIVSRVPWSGAETAHYRVLDDNDDPVGTLEMSIDPQSAGTVLFRQYFDFPDKKFTNEAKVTVDATTLLPKSTTFKIVGPQGNLDCSATYDGGEVKAHRIGEDGERDDSVTVPSVSYDNWADLFVWRTIDFAKGFEIKYADVLSCTLDKTQRLGVKLKVKGQESRTVPAGTYDTWHLEIDSGGDTQDAWYTTDDRHTLIRYDNGQSTFELTEAP